MSGTASIERRAELMKVWPMARRSPGALRGPLGLLTLTLVMSFCSPRLAHAFVTGAMQGHLLFNGAPVQVSAMTGPGALSVQLAVGNAVSVDAAGAYKFPDLPLGTYQPTVMLAATAIGQGAPTQATAGGIATVDMDVTSTAGLATGAITVNGQPFAGARITVDVNGTACSFGASGASFTMLLPPGVHTAVVSSALTGTPIGTLPISVQAGQTTNLGTVVFGTGALQGYVLYNGAPAPALAFAGSAAVTVRAAVGIAANVDANGAYGFANLPGGTYAPAVMLGANVLLQGSATPVTAGSRATAHLDVTASAGLATGVIAVNGQSVSVDRISVVGTGVSCAFGANASGRFQMLLPPGSYTATPRSAATGAAIGTFGFSVAAGATTDLGTVGFAAGSIEGTVLFNGAPVPALAMTGLGALVVQAGAQIATSVDSAGHFVLAPLPTGTYPLVLMHGANTLAQGPTTPVSVGSSTSASIDVTSSAGLVTGVIAVNGLPYPVSRIAVDVGGATWLYSTDASARFLMLLPPGSYTATPRSPATGAPIGSFAFVSIAGTTNGVAATQAEPGVTAFALSPTFPNPASGTSRVEYALPRRAKVRVTLLDLQGREMAVLADGICEAGRYMAALPAADLRAGIYFVRMQAPGTDVARRVAVVR